MSPVGLTPSGQWRTVRSLCVLRSGIPISATLLSVAPHPSKAHLHGGTFGPEGGPLAPVAYLLGMVALYLLYGTSRLGQVHEAFPFLANAS